jgi:hypothetical protein
MENTNKQLDDIVNALAPEETKKEEVKDEKTGPSEKEKDEVAQLAKKRYDLSKEYCKPYFDRFLDNYKHYFLRIIDEAIEQDPDSYPFYSTLSIPISYQIVETIIPRMFSRLPSFTITTEEENDENAEMQLKELIRYQLQHPHLIDDPIFSRMITALKELFITGNFWGEVPWEYKEAEVLEHQPYSIQMGTEPSWDNLGKLKEYGVEPDWKLVKTKKVVIDAPVFHHRSIFHVFPDPKRKRVSDLGWVIVEDFMTKGEIEDLIKMNPNKYQNTEVLADLKSWGDQAVTTDTNYDNEVAAIFGGADFTTRENGEPLFKVWFMKEPYKFSIIINETHTIRTGDNPNGDGKIGMFLCKDIPVPGQLFAWGEIDPIKKIEDAQSDQTNMRNDRVFKDLLDMWKLDPSTLVDGEEFIPEPGTVLQMNDLTGLQPIEGKQPNATAYREYQEWEKILQATTGATDYVTGNNDPGNTDTAEGISLMQQAANARFQMKLNLFEQIGLKAMGSMYVQRNRMFFDTKQTIKTESGPLTIDPSAIRMIRGNANFIVDPDSTSSSNLEKELKKWKVISELVAAGKPPFDNLSQESLDYVGKKMLLALGEREPEKILQRAPIQPTPIEGAPGALGGGMMPGSQPPEEQIPPELARAIAESQGGGLNINNQPNAQPNQNDIPQDVRPQ